LNEVNPLTDAGPKTTILAANLVFQFAVAAAGRNEGWRTGGAPRRETAKRGSARWRVTSPATQGRAATERLV